MVKRTTGIWLMDAAPARQYHAGLARHIRATKRP